MASVSGCLFEQVHEYPSEIYRRLISHISAQFVEARGCRHNLVSALPGVLVNVNGALYRVVRVYRVIRDLNVLTGEAAQDPKRFRGAPCASRAKEGSYHFQREFSGRHRCGLQRSSGQAIHAGIEAALAASPARRHRVEAASGHASPECTTACY